MISTCVSRSLGLSTKIWTVAVFFNDVFHEALIRFIERENIKAIVARYATIDNTNSNDPESLPLGSSNGLEVKFFTVLSCI